MDLGIVTSFYNGYDSYIQRWANSICMQSIKPSKVIIVMSGPVGDINNVKAAENILNLRKINYKLIILYEHKGMGYARNKAVEACDTEWIMYLDADDALLPDAIQNIAKYEKDTDVICTGLKILRGNSVREKYYFKSSNARAKQGINCSCSHSPYRKKFWELSPYIEQNDFCEQALWLGFAQQGARFEGTKELCTIYYSRKNGHNSSMTKQDKIAAYKQKKRFVNEGVKHD